ncbi:MAG: purine-nucleoside phosphorylase [Solirubrobacterales bacterium]|nr:purine-nucleoside phosphorylase [Solirubrobacterales bacterium]
MFNHARGLWGYTGTASDGEPLTIQATGLGAASAAIVTAELCALGLRTCIRIGTARSLDAAAGPAPGDVVTVTGALAGDGPSRALGASGTVRPDAALTERLLQQAGTPALVATADLTEPDAESLATWRADGARACDLQTATVLQVARTSGVAAGAVLVVTGALPGGSTPPLDDEALLAAVTAAAHAAAAALGLPSRDTPPLPPPRDDERVSA